MRRCLTIILAAGDGTRMKSRMAKVLHPIAGLPMVAHVIGTAVAGGADRVAVVVAPKAEAVRALVAARHPDATLHVQERRLGTAHAVRAAEGAWAEPVDDVIVLFGDTPLVTPETLADVRQSLAGGAGVVVVGFRPRDPTGYGRLIEQDGALIAIREHKDASEAERAVDFCNSGIMGIAGMHLQAILDAIGSENVQGEYYLTDAVEVANRAGLKVVGREASAEEVMGINDRMQLAACEAVFQVRARDRLMRGGVTMVAPETVFVSHDTEIGSDVTIEPNVWIGPGVKIEDGATIRFNSHLEGASVGADAIIGPFARLRPGARIDAGARVGNFVEIKNARIEKGAKVNHLTYIGDARIGAGANIGAGTITCNYDGFNKFHTDIGNGAFIGSNSALVAPVAIGDGAYIASGSVITDDVAENALAIGRGRQVEKPGWAENLRKIKADQKPD